ncbi:MAG TPA: deoxyribodipyrimidine photo-lyase [Acidobacteriaceae bacterium]|jgi:deoxyribodipyrimidine photo-lyase|nr:deoxyribodipyrimidine photo-lyase [Acidobacteriaceae bacterium]
MTPTTSVLMWFGRDLRLADNPALRAAVATGLPVVPIFLWAPEEEDPSPGAASRWWLHQSLLVLDRTLRAKGSRLTLRRGPTAETLLAIAAECNARRVFHNRVCEPSALQREPQLRSKLESASIGLEIFNGSLLFDPGTLTTTTGGPFQVFTPFWNALRNRRGELRSTGRSPRTRLSPSRWPQSLRVADLKLEPKIDWASGIRAAWTPGEQAARAALRSFARGAVTRYATGRDRTDMDGTSRLSPHLHFGEISPIQIWHAVSDSAGSEGYLRQIAWREFACHLLSDHPHTLTKPFNPQFRHFPWRANARRLKAWQQGQTGYPFVDAAMRQLWATGWMHNRARLVAASFLVKDLLIPWQLGAAWFLDTLVDADLANNTIGWQWVAGCGVDAAPYFRIFNPVLQGQKFDPNGDYIRRWVPELRGLPSGWIHRPWAAPPLLLATAGVSPGKTYPLPLVDHSQARSAALSALAQMKSKQREPTVSR